MRLALHQPELDLDPGLAERVKEALEPVAAQQPALFCSFSGLVVCPSIVYISSTISLTSTWARAAQFRMLCAGKDALMERSRLVYPFSPSSSVLKLPVTR